MALEINLNEIDKDQPHWLSEADQQRRERDKREMAARLRDKYKDRPKPKARPRKPKKQP